MGNNLYFFGFLLCTAYASDLLDVEFTTVVEALRKECFYQSATPTQIWRLEFRVIDAGVGRDLKISLYVVSPKMKTVVEEVNKAQAIRTFEVFEAGDYEVCLDNSLSRFSSKTVYFEVSAKSKKRTAGGKDKNDTIIRLERTANKVQVEMEKMKHYQDTLRAVEARDVHLQEKNLTQVNTFSSLATVVMMLFGGLQLFVLKSMFHPSSALFKIFRKLC